MSTESSSESWYDILGLRPTATDEEIGRAFRRLAREFHPDVTDAHSQHSAERFDEIARAYEILGDPGRRADYDRTRRRSPSPDGRGTRVPVRDRGSSTIGRPGPGTPERPAGMGADRNGPNSPEFVLSLSFLESLTGTTRRVEIEVDEPCGTCEGQGRVSGGRCPKCGGAGRTERISGTIPIHHVCSSCHGSGIRPLSRCSACGGSGHDRRMKQITVKVPVGIRDGARLRIPRPRDEAPVFATVRVSDDPMLSREGNDVVMTVPITFAEAALGAVTTINASIGESLQLVIAPGTRSGTRIPVPNAALAPPLRLVAEIEVVVPSELSDGERAALEAFARATRSPRE